MLLGNRTCLPRLAAAVLGTIAASPIITLGCPLCKDAIRDDPVAAAFNGTTLLMIAAPMVLVAAVGGWIAYLYWQHGRRAHAETVGMSESTAPYWPLLTEKESQT